jgi:large subunit ribosomal protein L2
MPLRKYKPTTPSSRFKSVSTFRETSGLKPAGSLIAPLKKSGGRNSAGRVTVRHRGGGNRRKLRKIDFKRGKINIPARVLGIQYDPSRSARIALLLYSDGEKSYIISPEGLAVGANLLSGPEAEPVIGNCLPLSKIPLGTEVHNVELRPGRGGQIARGAGGCAVLMSREGGYASLKLPSGEVRLVSVACVATVGRVGNADHENESKGKAGAKRWRGIRPTVRGVAMNPVDHPMGGGEGRASGGHPQSP